MADLLTSPLHDRHLALGAKLAEFGGWSMPLEYATGVVAEHTAVRSAVGLFDVSHLGKATVTGPGAAAYVDATLTNDLGRIGPGQAQYSLCCDDATGGIVDDLIVYLRGDDDVLLVPNAANTAEVVRRLAAGAPEGVVVTDRHRDFAVLAVQGPASDEVLAGAGYPVGHAYMSFVDVDPGDPAAGASDPERDRPDEVVTVCRTGYTGEKGYELVVPADRAGEVWDALVAAGEAYGIVPAGLGARDTLRTEMGYPLHGQDIGPTISPLQGRVGWAVGWSKPAFWGREALLAEKETGPARVLRGLLATGRGIPRPHMTVAAAEPSPAAPGGAGDEGAVAGGATGIVGEVTSGTFSPTLRKGVALALLDRAVALGDEVVVDIRGRAERFTVVAPPFVDPSVR